MILIGSRAMAIRAGNLLTRSPRDFDFICTESEYHNWIRSNKDHFRPKKIYGYENKQIVESDEANLEFEIVTAGTSSEKIFEIVQNDPESIRTSFGLVPTLDMLFTIKSAHRYKKFYNASAGFWKTLCDYHAMKKVGAEIRPEYLEAFKLRETESYAEQKHPVLNQTKSNFFKDDAVDYIFDHDSIHESQKFFDKPAYKYYARDNSEIFSDKKKFFECDDAIRLAGAIEETSVLSIERSYVPFRGTWAPKKAWMFALSKVASSITSGFFREFVYTNMFDIIRCYPENYTDRFDKAVRSGLVSRHLRG